MNDDLHDTPQQLLGPGPRSTPALTELIDSYARYHAVFVAVGSMFFVAFALLTRTSWRRLRRTRRSNGRRWSFERVTYMLFAASSAVLTLMMALLVAANLSNAVDPQPGFAGEIGTVGTSQLGTPEGELHHAFATWLQSGDSEMPALVSRTIDERLAWQQPKAIVCTALLVACTLLGAVIWRTPIRRSRARHQGRTPGKVALLLTGVLLGPLVLLLTAMVLGNTQAALAPLSMTLFYG